MGQGKERAGIGGDGWSKSTSSGCGRRVVEYMVLIRWGWAVKAEFQEGDEEGFAACAMK